MTKPKPSAPPSAGGNAAPAEQPTFRSNPEVDAKIDAYIKENPKYWAYVQAMPRERLERSVVLNEVRQLDRQQRMREGVLNQINRNPEMKRAYDILVKDLPKTSARASSPRSPGQRAGLSPARRASSNDRKVSASEGSLCVAAQHYRRKWAPEGHGGLPWVQLCLSPA